MESYLSAPRIAAPTDPYYDDATREFQGIPGIEISNGGRLWATWYGGGKTEDQYNYVLVSTSASPDEGFGTPVFAIDPDREGPVRAYDPCLWRDPAGRLWLFWAQGYAGHTDDRAGVWAIFTDNADSPHPKWSAPRRLCDGIMMNKPTVTTSGSWLISAARWRTVSSAAVYASDDNGSSWEFRGAASVPEDARNCDEHMIVERKNGDLWMLIRTSYGIGESVSTDEGKTWSAVEPSALAHPASRFFIRRLRSGSILLVKHGPLETRTERCELTAYLSDDDGASWKGGLVIDERVGVSYPDAAQAGDGSIYLIYDFDRKGAKEILYALFTEADVRCRQIETPETSLRLRVNKAG